MDLPVAQINSPSGITSPEDNDTPNGHSTANTPSQPSLSVDMPDFDEACMLALDAAMARRKESPSGRAPQEPSAPGTVEEAPVSSWGLVPSEQGKSASEVPIDAVVEMSDDDEVELDFEDFDTL